MRRLWTIFAVVFGLLFGGSMIRAAHATAQATAFCAKTPIGAIGRLYATFGPLISTHPLGPPISGEKSFETGLEILCGAEQDKFQEFQLGAIYYSQNEKTAFVLFDKVNAFYLSNRARLGLPTTSQIGSSARGTCRAYFLQGYLLCHGASNPAEWETGEWRSLSLAEMTARLYLPDLKMPFPPAVTGIFIGGPHAWSLSGKFNAIYPRGQGSGIDIAGTIPEFEVVAMAAGSVVEIYPDPLQQPTVDCDKEQASGQESKGLGCWVAVRNFLSGTVLIYGHIQPIPALRVGSWIAQGDMIGSTGANKIGAGSGSHLHIEFRTGTADCSENCPISGHQSSYGEPLDWHGVIVDGYLISSGLTKAGAGLNYDGTLVRINPGQFDLHHKYAQVELVNRWKSAGAFVFKTYLFTDHGETVEKKVNAWMTRAAAAACDRLYAGRCETNNAYNGTIFSWGPLKSSNQPNAGPGATWITAPRY